VLFLLFHYQQQFNVPAAPPAAWLAPIRCEWGSKTLSRGTPSSGSIDLTNPAAQQLFGRRFQARQHFYIAVFGKNGAPA